MDLNLLVILDALLRDASVTGAAHRLNLTQPAVSLALSRARALFNDPLLVRSGVTMRHTPLAEALGPRLAEVLAEVGKLFQSPLFDPALATRSFLLTTSDLAELLLLPGLMAQLRVVAPHVALTLRSVDGLSLATSEARDGQIDLTIAGLPRPDGPFEDATLFQDDFVMLVRKGHPALTQPLGIEAFAALPQVLVAPLGRTLSGPIDAALANYGLQRFIALKLTHLSALPGVIEHSDLVASVPRALAALPTFGAKLEARPLPFPSPRYALRMVWHRRHAADPGHLWLRDLVRNSAQALITDRNPPAVLDQGQGAQH